MEEEEEAEAEEEEEEAEEEEEEEEDPDNPKPKPPKVAKMFPPEGLVFPIKERIEIKVSIQRQRRWWLPGRDAPLPRQRGAWQAGQAPAPIKCEKRVVWWRRRVPP